MSCQKPAKEPLQRQWLLASRLSGTLTLGSAWVRLQGSRNDLTSYLVRLSGTLTLGGSWVRLQVFCKDRTSRPLQHFKKFTTTFFIFRFKPTWVTKKQNEKVEVRGRSSHQCTKTKCPQVSSVKPGQGNRRNRFLQSCQLWVTVTIIAAR